MGESFDTGENFLTKDNIGHPRNTQYPIIIKRSKSAEQLKNLMVKVRDTGILHIGFIREMIDTTSDKEIQDILSAKNEQDIEYLGIGIFGENDQVNKLTKKFGLWE